ncbi:MAG: hypothetical protein JXR63_04960 [Spirochaetales bacterium]|nr:hypothetical protein [Spirochaetales bacterium]
MINKSYIVRYFIGFTVFFCIVIIFILLSIGSVNKGVSLDEKAAVNFIAYDSDDLVSGDTFSIYGLVRVVGSATSARYVLTSANNFDIVLSGNDDILLDLAESKYNWVVVTGKIERIPRILANGQRFHDEIRIYPESFVCVK